MRVLQILVMEAASITFAVFAGLLALNALDGWGWFMAASLICGVSSVGGTQKESK